MDFHPSARQLDLVKRVESIAESYCSESEELARNSSTQFPLGLYEAITKSNLLNTWEEAGPSSPYLDNCMISEALAYHSATAASLFFVNCACRAMLKKGAYAPHGLQSGSIGESAIFAFALTELNAGSDASAIATTARSIGDQYEVNGEKSFVTGAVEANFILTAVRTDCEDTRKSGASILLVPADAKGLSVCRLQKVAGNAHATCRVKYRNVRVPKAHIVGIENQAWSLLSYGGMIERLLVAAGAVGLARRSFDKTSSYLMKRRQFGHAITDFQAVRHRLADMAAEIEAMQWMTYHAAWLMDQSGRAFSQVNMAKVYCTERGHRVVAECLRLVGGRAYFYDDELNQAWRESALGFYAGGANEVIRDAIARTIAPEETSR